MNNVTPCLWFDTEAEDAANFYTSVFEDSKILGITRYGDAGPGPEGTVLTVIFELRGQEFVALNGGPEFTFSEAVPSRSAVSHRRRSTGCRTCHRAWVLIRWDRPAASSAMSSATSAGYQQ